MSLSSFVELPDVKERLRRDIQKPWFQERHEIEAPPLSTSYGLTGSAFDYLLRFYVEKLNRSAKKGPWVAEKSLAILAMQSQRSSAFRRARGIVETGKALHDEYLKNRSIEKPAAKMIRVAIRLAELDLVYRIGLLDFQHIDDDVVEDLRSLLSLVRPDDFRAKKVCVLNPTFGMASGLVGGADADLFIDGTMIEVKTSKHLKMKRDIFNQLLGYYCLSCIGGVDRYRGKVRAIGIYYARYGLLYRLNIKSLVDSRRWSKLLAWFERRARTESKH